MKPFRRVGLAAAFFVAAVGLQARAQIQVSHIPPPDGETGCSALTINEPGQVLVGCPTGSYLWNSASRIYLQIPAGTGWAVALNNLGHVVGSSREEQTGDHESWIWSPEAGRVTISRGVALGINDLGDTVLGEVFGGPVRFRRADGAEFVLPGGWVPAFNQPLNNLPQVALGHGVDERAAIWSPTDGLLELPPLPDLPPPPNVLYFQGTHVRGFNDAGRLAGDFRARGFTFAPGEGYVPLSEGAAISTPYHVNSLGHLSGDYYDSASSLNRAVYWQSPASRVDLPSLDGASAQAWASNSAGKVVGGNGDGRMLLWQLPPPSPVTPSEHVAVLQAELISLTASGALSANDASGLIAKLNAIVDALAKDNLAAASRVLQALSNQVEALESSGRISSADAASLQALIEAAMASMD